MNIYNISILLSVSLASHCRKYSYIPNNSYPIPKSFSSDISNHSSPIPKSFSFPYDNLYDKNVACNYRSFLLICNWVFLCLHFNGSLQFNTFPAYDGNFHHFEIFQLHQWRRFPSKTVLRVENVFFIKNISFDVKSCFYISNYIWC